MKGRKGRLEDEEGMEEVGKWREGISSKKEEGGEREREREKEREREENERPANDEGRDDDGGLLGRLGKGLGTRGYYIQEVVVHTLSGILCEKVERGVREERRVCRMLNRERTSRSPMVPPMGGV